MTIIRTLASLSLFFSLVSAWADPVVVPYDPLVPDAQEEWPEVAEAFSNLRQNVESLVGANEEAEIAALTCQQRFSTQPALRRDCLAHVLDQLAAVQQSTIVDAVVPFREKIREGHGFADERQVAFIQAQRRATRARTDLEFELQRVQREAGELLSQVDPSTDQMDRATRQSTTKLMQTQEALTSRLRLHEAGFERLEIGQQAIGNIRELYNRFDDFARLLELDLNHQTSGLQDAKKILDMLLPLEEAIGAAQGLDESLAKLEHERAVLNEIDLNSFFDLDDAPEIPEMPDQTTSDTQLLQFLHDIAEQEGE